VPPVMAFHLGSLGFLSPFEFLDYREKVDDVLQGLLSLFGWFVSLFIDGLIIPLKQLHLIMHQTVGLTVYIGLSGKRLLD